jgi:SAM-dependent methyltransferase
MKKRSALNRQLRHVGRALGLIAFYQRRRDSATEVRWSMIARALRPSDRSLLDIGCNIGLITRLAAEHGLFALGIDVLDEAIEEANRLHRGIPGLAFATLELAPGTIGALPSCDAALLLSVHHRWSHHHGEAASWAMIGELLRRTRTLFFEPASSHVRYGDATPDFAENDSASIRDYVERHMRRVADGRRVTYLGATPSLGQEPERLLFMVR